NVSLGGQKLEVTVMFCDIRGFTTLSEHMEPEAVVSLLNSYFTGLEKCIASHGGVINKYIGDAVMALFGAPLPSSTQAKDAYLAAVDMRTALSQMNKGFAEKGMPEIHFGIGLHSGPVLAGNIGASSRMEYTVIGDTVNTASRIEGLCKTYKTDLLVSETTARLLETELDFVDESEIRGRKEKVKLYTKIKGQESK
ncbi:MAG: adenylate/guanylate cyclase domain-containing protein, partial [Treponema sp.]|nr:adenylate/guanylate cyclase domain-containing protein [Treponema sp.]